MPLALVLSLLDLFIDECVVHRMLVTRDNLVQAMMVVSGVVRSGQEHGAVGAPKIHTTRGRPKPDVVRFVRERDAGFLRGLLHVGVFRSCIWCEWGE